TLMDLIRRLRYNGYLDHIGITEREPGEVFEKLIEHLASTHHWLRVRSDRFDRAKKSKSKKPAMKSSKTRKAKTAPEPEEIATEPVKLHYLIDRRDFLEKVKTVYAH